MVETHLRKNTGLFEALNEKGIADSSAEFDVYEVPDIVVGAVSYSEKVSTIWGKIKSFMHENGLNMDFVLFSNYPALVRAVEHDVVDVGWVTPLAYLQVKESLGEVNVLGMRDTDRNFESVIFTKKGSGIDSVDDLEGKTLALGSRDSAQSNILPRHHLEEDEGLTLTTQADQHIPLDGVVRLVTFDIDVGKHGDTGRSESEVARAVRSGEADAGAIGKTVYEAFVDAGILDGNEHEVVWTSPGFSHCNFCAKTSFPEETAERFYEILDKMDYDDPDHKVILDLEGCTEWLPGTEEGYDDLERAAEQV